MKIMLRGRKVIGGLAEGEAVVTKEPVSFLGGVNPDKGVVVERGHELEGQSITGKIFVFPHGKGSTAMIGSASTLIMATGAVLRLAMA